MNLTELLKNNKSKSKYKSKYSKYRRKCWCKLFYISKFYNDLTITEDKNFT